MIKHLIIFLILSLLSIRGAIAQTTGYGKMSSYVRQVAMMDKADKRKNLSASPQQRNKASLTAFVRTNSTDILTSEGCNILASWGDIHITEIPVARLQSLASHEEIKRIEASRRSILHVDTTATLLGVEAVWHPKATESVSQGYTGKGVVVGVEDVGFDLTHPTFHSTDFTESRIRRFWDMLSPRTEYTGAEGTDTMYVGMNYTSPDAIRAKAHATDGMKQTHGTHTTGIAAGSGMEGYGTVSPYIGMAPDADLCLVANAVSDDKEFIQEEDEAKYTTATDILGFKYIMDYAESVQKPCVISFSEGTHEDLYGDSKMLGEVLDSLTGPGRIICASAGNQGELLTYLRKQGGDKDTKSYIYGYGTVAYFTLQTNRSDAYIRLSFCEEGKTTSEHFIAHRDITVSSLFDYPDSLLIDTLHILRHPQNEADVCDYLLMAQAYPSCYDDSKYVMEFLIKDINRKYIGQDQRVALALIGKEADIDCISSGGYYYPNCEDGYNNAVSTHNIHFPSSAPAVICVGATTYRPGVMSYEGIWKEANKDRNGARSSYSSVGPTLADVTKPDVMAPGTNIISAYSSYYLENNPDANDIKWDVSHFDYAGRTYAWNSNSGTSMSCPMVAGIIALWLQACPTLTPEQAIETIRETSRHLDSYNSVPNNEWGYGEICADKGLKYILENFAEADAIKEITIEDPAYTTARKRTFDLLGRAVKANQEIHGIYVIRDERGVTRKVLR